MRKRANVLLLSSVALLAAVDSADIIPKNSVVHNNRFKSQPRVPKIEKYRYDKTSLQELHSISNEGLELSASDQEYSGVVEQSKQQQTRRNGLFDDLDKQIFMTALPLSAIFAIFPLANAIDLFWVNRLGNTLAVAGQAAANQVYNSAFWLFSFLPSVTATLVSKSHAKGDLQGTQDAVCQALSLSILIGLFGASFMFFFPTKALGSILKANSPTFEIARPYLRIRAFSLFPMLLSFVGFSAFRGTMEVQTSVKVSFASQFVTILLEPILVHVLKIGVRGAAMSSLAGETAAALIYLKLLVDRQLLSFQKVFRIPPMQSLLPLLKGGISLQVKSLCMNLTFLMVARVIQSLDDTGVSAAAHALAAQTFQLGGIFLGALGVASQTMVPTAMVKTDNNGSSISSITSAKPLIKRLLQWGSTLGVVIGLVQLIFLPAILKSSPLEEVRQAARAPALIAMAFQAVNGVVSVGEGIMMGSGSFIWLSINSVFAALGYLGALRVFPDKLGLTGVWVSLSFFMLIRMVGVMVDLFVRMPLKEKSQKQTESEQS